MAYEKILIVEDEDDVMELMLYNLGKEKYKCLPALNGREGLEIALSKKPDLILLDLMLPEIDGLEVCKKLKNHSDTEQIPIIMVTAKSDETDIITGLELGAEDYVTKPFSPKVLLARVRAVLRRKNHKPNTEPVSIKLHDIEIDPGRHRVLVNGKQIELTSTEFGLLNFLASRPGWVFTRYQIVDGVHGNDYPVTDRSIDVQVVGLRKKLGSAGKYIETVRGIGYRFKE